MLDVKQLAAEVYTRNGIRVEVWDPAFALVTLNQLVLEDIAKLLSNEVRSAIAEFNDGAQKTEKRAGKILAQEVKEAAAELRRELQRDIESARVNAAAMVAQVDRAHRRSAVVRWGGAGLISAAALFISGLWIGAQYIR